MTKNIVKVAYQMTECGRCGGSGHFGPSSIDSGKCFTCRGGGKVYTANGLRAKKRYDSIAGDMNKPLLEIVAGDKVYLDLLVHCETAQRTRGWVVATGVQTETGKVKLNGKPLISGRVTFEATGKLIGFESAWNSPAETHIVKTWSDELHEQAARAVMSLKGATVTGL